MASKQSSFSVLPSNHFLRPPDGKSIPNQDVRVSSFAYAGDNSYQEKNLIRSDLNPNLNSLTEFPVLQLNSKSSEDSNSILRSKSWKEVISANKYHNKSIQLKYYEPTIKNNVRYASIGEHLISEARKKWQNSVAFYVYGNIPYYKYLKEYIDRSWQITGGYQLYTRENGFYIIKLDSQEDCDNLLAGGPYFYNKRLIFMKKWHPGLKMSQEFLHSIPIWVQLSNLELDLWSVEAISKIASVIGQPIKLDQVTEELIRISYARILVEIDVNCSFPAEIPVQCFDGSIIWQKVKYEWIPQVCTNCRVFGHSVNVCTAKKVWRQKEILNRDSSMEEDLSVQININEGNKESTLNMEVDSSTSKVDGNVPAPNRPEDIDVNCCNSNAKGKELSSSGQIKITCEQSLQNGLPTMNIFEVLNPTMLEDNDRINDLVEPLQLDKGCMNYKEESSYQVDYLNINKEKIISNDNIYEEMQHNSDTDDCNAHDVNMQESVFLSESLKKRKNKVNLNNCNGDAVVIDGEPFVETNPKWNNLVAQLKNKSRNKKVKEENNLTGGVKSKVISKK